MVFPCSGSALFWIIRLYYIVGCCVDLNKADSATNNNIEHVLRIQLRNEYLHEQFLLDEFSYQGAEDLIKTTTDLPFRDIHADSFFRTGVLQQSNLRKYIASKNITQLFGPLTLKPWVPVEDIKNELAKCGVQYNYISMSQQHFSYDKHIYGTMNVWKFACRYAFDEVIVFGVGMERFRFRFKDVLLNKLERYWASTARTITIRDMQKLMNYFSSRFAESMKEQFDKEIKRLTAVTNEMEEEEEELMMTDAPQTTTTQAPTTVRMAKKKRRKHKGRRHRKLHRVTTTTTTLAPTTTTMESAELPVSIEPYDNNDVTTSTESPTENGSKEIETTSTTEASSVDYETTDKTVEPDTDYGNPDNSNEVSTTTEATVDGESTTTPYDDNEGSSSTSSTSESEAPEISEVDENAAGYQMHYPFVSTHRGCIQTDPKSNITGCNNLRSISRDAKDKLSSLFPTDDIEELPYMTKDHMFQFAMIPITVRVMLAKPGKIPEILDIFQKDLSTDSRDVLENCIDRFCEEPDEIVELHDEHVNDHHPKDTRSFFQDRALRFNLSPNSTLLAYATSSPKCSLEQAMRRKSFRARKVIHSQITTDTRAMWYEFLQSQVSEIFAVHHRPALHEH
uniref:ULP_PROTEASE domain-containing protein n=1 Tax=Panagrellus redivivus TaxID=6233 RepID=A0A7E4V6V0_PANRE